MAETGVPVKAGKTLLDLPPKLRNHIYDLALTEEAPIKIALHSGWCLVARTPQFQAFPPVPNLIKTCRQTLQEALPVYYSSNTFLVDYYEAHDLDRWLRRRGVVAANFVKHVGCDFSMRQSHYPFENATMSVNAQRGGEAHIAFGGALESECVCGFRSEIENVEDQGRQMGDVKLSPVSALIECFAKCRIGRLRRWRRGVVGTCDSCGNNKYEK